MDQTPQHDSTTPASQPVVVAVVISERGVLLGRRNDGKPPWTFIAGEIEPGESPADAGVREVKEETGLLVAAGQEIGRRVHPTTGRTMIYVAARPMHGTDIFVGDRDELAEVRWVALAEAEQLMQPYGMFGPVRKYLAKMLH
jgi:8-oxo-dGTP pyrophosphatase MutT (NUDIX family)